MARRSCTVVIALVAIGCGETKREPAAAPSPIAKPASDPAPTTVEVSGVVIDRATGAPVGPVDVILRNHVGDLRIEASNTGEFTTRVEPGRYRAFVASDTLLSTGLVERVRLDTGPRRDLAQVADDGLMPVLDVTTDLRDVELGVTAAGVLEGFVRDPHGDPVFNAIVRVRRPDRLGGLRPVIGSDIAETDGRGYFTLKAPAGRYVLDAAYPLFAGAIGDNEVMIEAGKTTSAMVTLARGCIITGRVVNADGSPAHDGALEGLGPRGRFGPTGRIDAGRFWWATTDDESVTLRAWPWHSPPSPARTFECRDGKRFNDVVLRVPEQRPDIAGVIVDANDQPVPLAYIDIQPLDPIVGGQQERSDASGTWHVYDMPPARYRITATAPGHGIVDTMVVAPRRDLRLQLGGTGRIVGATPALVTGSVEVSFLFCGPKDQPLLVAHESRIVPIAGGRFTIERAPACALSLVLRWRDKLIESTVVVDPDRTSYLDLEIGAPREKTVTGTVRDTAGNPVNGARVTAIVRDREAATVRTDGNGRYTLQTHAGAQLVAGKAEHSGRGTVGRANVETEIVDLVLDGAGF